MPIDFAIELIGNLANHRLSTFLLGRHMIGSNHLIRILTINGGSSSIKLAVFEADRSLRRILEGGIERIGLPEATFTVKGMDKAESFSRQVAAPDHTAAVAVLMDWIEKRSSYASTTQSDVGWPAT